MHLKMSGKWRPFCFGPNMLMCFMELTLPVSASYMEVNGIRDLKLVFTVAVAILAPNNIYIYIYIWIFCCEDDVVINSRWDIVAMKVRVFLLLTTTSSWTIDCLGAFRQICPNYDNCSETYGCASNMPSFINVFNFGIHEYHIIANNIL